MRGFVPRLIVLARQLLNEVVGLIFLALAIFCTVGAHGLISTFQRLDEHPDEFWHFLAASAFALMFGAFAFSSFWRARKLGRMQDTDQ